MIIIFKDGTLSDKAKQYQEQARKAEERHAYKVGEIVSRYSFARALTKPDDHTGQIENEIFRVQELNQANRERERDLEMARKELG